ncbi:MAG: hypothetical protein JWM04_2554, partial [Verrucomicrobiales bacterium]|nr:hypothetical protein [Verrucomicrobiales bacterium]
MQKTPLQLTPLLTERLASFKRRARRLTAFLWLWVAIASGLGILLLSASADYFIGPTDGWRILLSGLGYFLFVSLLVFGGWRTWKYVATQSQAAREFESRTHGILEEKLISAVQLVEESGRGEPESALTDWMKLQVLRQAEEAVSPISIEGVLPSRKVKQSFIPAFLLSAVVALLLIWETPRIFLARAFFPLAKIDRPTTNDFEVAPGDQSIDSGSDFIITAAPRHFKSSLRAIIFWSDGVKEVVPLTQLDTNRFSATITRVAKPFRYLVQAGGLKSPNFSVQLRMPPRLQNLALWNQPPSYLGTEQIKLAQDNARIVVGSRLRVEAKHDGSKNEVVRLTFEGANSTNTADIVAVENFSAWFSPTQSFAYHAELIQSNKVMETTLPFSVTVIPDAAPSIRWQTNEIKRFFNANDTITIEGSAFDDVALADGRLVLRSESGDVITNILFNASIHAGRLNIATQADFNVTIPLKNLRVTQGESFSVRAEIRDLAGNMTNSDYLTSIVVSDGSSELAALIGKLRGILSALKTSHTRLDDLNQAWIAASQNAGAGAQGYEAELVVWEARARTVCAALSAEGEETFMAARGANGFYGNIIDQLGHSLSGWADVQDGIMSHAVSASLSKGAKIEKELLSGRAYLSSALEEIQQYERDYVLVINCLESEVLRSLALSAQERYRPVLRNITGLEGWSGNLPLLGFLHADFFSGTNTDTTPIFSDNEVPELLNLNVPGLGKTNWTAEFKGELYLPEAGNWWLRGIANDGAEISLDGDRLDDLSKEFSLKGDFVTKFRSVVGWHPFKVRLHQNVSESRLSLKISSDTELFTSIPSDWLRTSRIETNAFAAQMSLLSSRDPQALVQSLKDLVSHLLLYPTNVSKIATETEIPKIAFFAFRCNQDARDIREALLAKQLKPMERKILEIRSDELVGTIVETHKTLLEHLRNVENRLPKASIQTQWEQLLSARLRTLLRVLRRNGNSWEISEGQRQENIQKEI